MVPLLVKLFLLASVSCPNASPVVPYSYHSYETLTQRLRQLTSLYPEISTLYSIGKSVENRDLWVIAIGKHPTSHVLLRPNVKLVAGLHANEATTKEISLHYAEHLLSHYKDDVNISLLLNRTLIHILPLLNPDGLQLATPGLCDGDGRENANGKDLNRNFPDAFHEKYQPEHQNEVVSVMRWLHDKRFALSASLHSGALLVSRPYDNYVNSLENDSFYSPTPDDDVFRRIAAAYSFSHTEMYQQIKTCEHAFHDGSLVNGTINGADWYASNGTMQDYNYIFGSCMELTLEVGCCKYPDASELKNLWMDNKYALLNFTSEVHVGVLGQVTDGTGKALTNVSVMIDERMPVDVSDRGEFWKLLLPGRYTLKVLRNLEVIWEQDFLVEESGATVLNVTIDFRFSKRAANFSSLPPDRAARIASLSKLITGSRVLATSGATKATAARMRGRSVCAALALAPLLLSYLLRT